MLLDRTVRVCRGHVGDLRIWGRFLSKVGGLFLLGMKDGGAEAEAEAGAGAAWWSVIRAIRARWEASSEWSSVMSIIICSGECGLIGPCKVGGGAIDIFEILGRFCVFFVFFRIGFWRKWTLGSKIGAKSKTVLRNCVLQMTLSLLFFRERRINR
jgi:hypothetical protein